MACSGSDRTPVSTLLDKQKSGRQAEVGRSRENKVERKLLRGWMMRQANAAKDGLLLTTFIFRTKSLL